MNKNEQKQTKMDKNKQGQFLFNKIETSVPA